MTELKTLKDLWVGEAHKELLKAEAVKWVKSIRRVARETTVDDDVSLFKTFFNLTEEDLNGST